MTMAAWVKKKFRNGKKCIKKPKIKGSMSNMPQKEKIMSTCQNYRFGFVVTWNKFISS